MSSVFIYFWNLCLEKRTSRLGATILINIIFYFNIIYHIQFHYFATKFFSILTATLQLNEMSILLSSRNKVKLSTAIRRAFGNSVTVDSIFTNQKIKMQRESYFRHRN